VYFRSKLQQKSMLVSYLSSKANPSNVCSVRANIDCIVKSICPPICKIEFVKQEREKQR